MSAVTFQTIVSEEQVIRPPADLRLPLGAFEVTLRPVPTLKATLTLDAANQIIRRCRVSLGHATGIDNDDIDADLARSHHDFSSL